MHHDNFDKPKPLRRNPFRDFQPIYLWFGFIFLVIAGMIGLSLAAQFKHDTYRNCVVDDKDRSISITSDGDGNTSSTTDYRVYAECDGKISVFQVADSLFNGKFASADTYAGIKIGKTYDFHTIGWRVPFLSMFPNILEYDLHE